MSNSYRKTPIIGHTMCESEKQDKKLWHKKWRAKEKININMACKVDVDSYLSIQANQVSSVWLMGKDGKQYLS
ncbi:hypothetical protein [Fangia hongkongensis]|uniref:hypothetical protein n=1 Tax=Fangia hongkongensis TaxID=270495 RepID=UPI00036D32FC|nr:hypothetical protein [Fangia hongkongensis]MBK2124927.1 hypothetical protein [Fangia hongkongensis]